ncbi:MAG TPA: ATP-grasp domain-containing protein [Chloroflexota bacterium]
MKSRKHEWNEACFIPSAADRAGAERVVKRFVELQGDDLAQGLVFRELGDGQVAGLPDSADPAEFYRALAGGLLLRYDTI